MKSVVAKNKSGNRKVKRTGKSDTPPEPTPLPWDVFPPLKCALFENGKLVKIESFDDPRKSFCEFYNASSERTEQMFRERGIERPIRRAGPIQEDPEDWSPEMAEQYLVEMLARVRKAKRAAARKAGKVKPDTDTAAEFAALVPGFNAALDGLSAALAGKAVQA
jgi:hypothetical protein